MSTHTQLQVEIDQFVSEGFNSALSAFDPRLKAMLDSINNFHISNCPEFGAFVASSDESASITGEWGDLPYLPTSIFKGLSLRSVSSDEIFREVQSSATSVGRPSRIFLDRANNTRWTRSLLKIMGHRVGLERFDLILLDEELSSLKGPISARSSMSIALMQMSSTHEAFMEFDPSKGQLDLVADKLIEKLKSIGDGSNCLIFGFTYVLYVAVVERLERLKESFALPGLTIVHAGGWKKLQDRAISAEVLNEKLVKTFGVQEENIIDVYGFTEQGGMFYPTCKYGFRHPPPWGEVLVRDLNTLKLVRDGEQGLLQFFSVLQTSYPGHSIISEDVGYIVSRSSCRCGMNNTAFKVLGRSDVATEVRGCGDILGDFL